MFIQSNEFLLLLILYNIYMLFMNKFLLLTFLPFQNDVAFINSEQANVFFDISHQSQTRFSQNWFRMCVDDVVFQLFNVLELNAWLNEFIITGAIFWIFWIRFISTIRLSEIFNSKCYFGWRWKPCVSYKNSSLWLFSPKLTVSFMKYTDINKWTYLSSIGRKEVAELPVQFK